MLSRTVEGYEFEEFIYCVCGCLKTRSKIDVKRRIRHYIRGHHYKGAKRGKDSPLYKRGFYVTSGGYIGVSKDKYQHKIVYEDFNKCCILKWGVVHHKDGNKQNNNPLNLEGMMRSKHLSLHNSKTEELSKRKCAMCGSNKTAISSRKEGYKKWYRYINDGEYICDRCYNSERNRRRRKLRGTRT